MQNQLDSQVINSPLYSRHCSHNVRTGLGGRPERGGTDGVGDGEREMELECHKAKVEKVGISDAAAELFGLQVEQFRHDEIYHREIVRLTVHGKLNHTALHFCKYVGQFTEATLSGNFAKIHRAIVDTFIINLCAANALNLRLSIVMPGADIDAKSLADLSRKLVGPDMSSADPSHELVLAFAIEAGKVARACEKIDHLEAFSFRESISSALGNIAQLCLVASNRFDLSLVYEVRKRLREVEEKYLFHNAF